MSDHPNYMTLQKALRLACKEVAECSGSCPLDVYDWPSCPATNDNDTCKDQYAECWEKYFLEEASHETS